MSRPSLKLRIIATLVVTQILAFPLAWLVTIGLGHMGFDGFVSSLDELSSVRATKQVIASLTLNKQGELEIRPTEDLLDEMKRAPGMKFAAFRSPQKEPIAGSSPDLLPVLQSLIEINPGHVHFVLPGDPSSLRSGLMDPRRTPFGRLHIAVYGQKFRWSDVFDAALDVTRFLIPYLVVAVMVSATVTWVAVHWGLSPMKRVASQASRIDMNSLYQRLDTNHVSTEIFPLVEAVNGALARLDEGVARQRRFTANAAHELRTPVAILTARIDAPKEPSFLTDLECDARRIHAIVEQMLSTARLNEYRPDVNEQVNLTDVASATVADIALLAIKRRRQITFEGPDEDVYVRGSRFAVESVLRNLIENALRAEPENGTVIVGVGPDAVVEVLDHGEGVAESDREAIFEAFWRKRETTPGTGLGLAIARQLMELQGGRIWVEETPGGGATFKVVFPTAISA